MKRPRTLARATVVLDAGAFIAAGRGSDRWRAIMRRLAARDVELAVPAGALTQAWRGTPRQARLALFLADRRVSHVPWDHVVASAPGVLLARTGTAHAVEAPLALFARTEACLLRRLRAHGRGGREVLRLVRRGGEVTAALRNRCAAGPAGPRPHDRGAPRPPGPLGWDQETGVG